MLIIDKAEERNVADETSVRYKIHLLSITSCKQRTVVLMFSIRFLLGRNILFELSVGCCPSVMNLIQIVSLHVTYLWIMSCLKGSSAKMYFNKALTLFFSLNIRRICWALSESLKFKKCVTVTTFAEICMMLRFDP